MGPVSPLCDAKQARRDRKGVLQASDRDGLLKEHLEFARIPHDDGDVSLWSPGVKLGLDIGDAGFDFLVTVSMAADGHRIIATRGRGAAALKSARLSSSTSVSFGVASAPVTGLGCTPKSA